jgi:hypothetical protein
MANGSAVTAEALMALLDSGAVGSEPVMRIRGDAVVMTSSLMATLGADSIVQEDFTELRWFRSFGPMLSASQLSVSLVSPASGVAEPPEPAVLYQVTVQVTAAKQQPDVMHAVRFCTCVMKSALCM